MNTTVPAEPSVETALDALVAGGSLAGFSAELERTGAGGVRRRIEVGGDGRVRVAWSGSVEGAPARSIGVREATVDPAVLQPLVAACRKAAPALVQGGRAAILRVQVADASASGSVPGVALPALVAAFEAVATRALPLSELTLALAVRREGNTWSGTVRLSNAGTQPLVVPSPARAARDELLTLLRDGEPRAGFVVEGEADALVVLGPDAWTEARFQAPASDGGTLVLQWALGSPVLDAFHGAFSAPEGIFESAPVAT